MSTAGSRGSSLGLVWLSRSAGWARRTRTGSGRFSGRGKLVKTHVAPTPREVLRRRYRVKYMDGGGRGRGVGRKLKSFEIK